MARTIKPSDGLTVQAMSERLAAKFGEKPVKLSQLLQKWILARIVKPKGSIHRGPGNYREFEPEELDKAALLFELRRYRFPLDQLHTIRRLLDAALVGEHAGVLDEAREGKAWAMRIGLLEDGITPSLGLFFGEAHKVYPWNSPKVMAAMKNAANWRSLLIVRVDTILHDL